MQVIGFIFDMAEGIIWLCGALGLLLGILYMLYDVLIKQVLLNKEVPIKTKIIEAIIVLLIILGGCGYWNYNYN
nr:MAG TPA_asm: hypothetical protein [Caudoviricetes sp.]